MSEVIIDNKHYDIEGILFDKDGTLLDFAALWYDWSLCWIDRLIEMCPDIELDRAQLATVIGLDINRVSWDPEGPLAIGSNDDLKALLSSLLYQKGVSWNEAITIVTKSRESADSAVNWKDSLKSVKGLEVFLEKLYDAQVRLGVVTSDDTKQAQLHLSKLGIAEYFGSIIGHDAVPRGKPFPDSVEKACQALQIRPEKTLIIGDSNGDMITGTNAQMLAKIGIVPMQIETYHHLKEADHIIQDYENMNVLHTKEGEK